ncbi:MAG: DegT/DnrJ/EryC1/StrS aminotransferase family protein [Anaerolineae bacterium]|nr:DegT/DnrJ/EryC1/StrS aminotransferase family protein [Anaerolineae bacterium]
MIPFYRPYFDYSEFLAALRPGVGRIEFEAAVAKRMGARYGVAFAYGRSGIAASFKALKFEQAEIVLPAYTCIVMAQALLASGNRPVFVDIDLTNYNMDLNALRAALTPHTRAIIATHLYGYPTDVDAIRAIVGNAQIVIIEDCAQRLPVSPNDSPHFRGDIGLCSFGPNKEVCTVQGGVVVTNSLDLYQKIKNYRDQELNRLSLKTWAKRWIRLLANYLVFHKPVYGLLHGWGLVGLDKRFTENSNFEAAKLPGDYATAYMDFQARVGLAQLRKLETIVSRHRALAELYTQELQGIPNVTLPPILPEAHYTYYTLRIPQRDALNFRSQMLFRGVSVDETYEYSLPTLKPYRSYAKTQYPGAMQAARQVVNLPIYPHLSVTSGRYIANDVRSIFENRLHYD